MKSVILGPLAGASTAVALVSRRGFRVPISDLLSEPRFVASWPTPLAWALAAAAGAVVGAWVGGWLKKRDAADVLSPMLLPGLAVAAYVPGLLSIVPLFAAGSGTLLDLVLLGCTAATLWRAGERLAAPVAPGGRLVAVAALIVYLALGFRMQEGVGLSGDEPHYLLITYSLLHDRDLAVLNNYTNQDYRAFYSGKIGPHLAQGTPYSVHGAGLPLLLLPGFAVLGLTGVLLTEAVLGAFLVREVTLAAEQLCGSRPAALVAGLGFGFTAPALFLNVSAYPELPAAVVVAGTFRRLLNPSPPGPVGAAAWGLAPGLLPLLHVKFFPLGVVLALAVAGRWRKVRWWSLAGYVLGLALLVAFFVLLHGGPNPLAPYGRQRVFVERVPTGLAGLLFDQTFGLLPASPFYFAALVSLGFLLRRRPHAAMVALGVLAAVALPGAAHPLWSGGSSPPARFLFPALPPLAVAASALWSSEPRRGIAPWIRVLLVVSLCLGGYMAFGPDQPLYVNQRDGTGRLWVALGDSWDLAHYFPSLVRADGRSVTMAAAGTVLLLGGLLIHWTDRRWRLPPFVLVGVVGFGLLDLVAPGRVAPESLLRWMTSLMREIAQPRENPLMLLPSARTLTSSEVLHLIEIPLSTTDTSGEDENRESREWTSPSLQLPAGRFELLTETDQTLRLFNGDGCFSSVEAGREFTTRVALARFHVRARLPVHGLRLKPISVEPSSLTADRSLDPGSGVRIHSLDERAFLEPDGFWVRAGSRAAFAVEGDCAGSCLICLTNGGVDNWVEVTDRDASHRFRLRPWEAREMEISVAGGVSRITVTSRAGFRPADLDPRAGDRRALGVFLTSRGCAPGSGSAEDEPFPPSRPRPF